MTLTKSDIIDSIHNSRELPKNNSAGIVDSLLEIIKQALEKGEGVIISGFGKLCVKNKNKLMKIKAHLSL